MIRGGVCWGYPQDWSWKSNPTPNLICLGSQHPMILAGFWAWHLRNMWAFLGSKKIKMIKINKIMKWAGSDPQPQRLQSVACGRPAPGRISRDPCPRPFWTFLNSHWPKVIWLITNHLISNAILISYSNDFVICLEFSILKRK